MKNSIQSTRRFLVKLWLLSKKLIQYSHSFLGKHPNNALNPDIHDSSLNHELVDSVVIITGSSKGIGLALAEIFLENKATVVINGRNRDALKNSLAKLQSKYAKVTAIAADAATAAGATLLVEESVKRFGKVDILINNAGTIGDANKTLWEVSESQFNHVLKTNVTGPFLCSKELILWAKKAGHSIRIVNVSSGIVNLGAPRLSAYAISKMALEGLTLSIEEDCKDCASPPVVVVSIKPRSVQTDMTRSFFRTTEYALFDSPAVLGPAFLFAATASAGQIMGKSLSEPTFQADPDGETVLNNRFSGIKPTIISPAIFTPENTLPGVDRSGAHLHLMQNAFHMNPAVAQTLATALNDAEMHGYPDPNYTNLRIVLAEQLGVSQDSLLFGPGSSQIIEYCIEVFANRKAQAVLTRPTWGNIIWPIFLRCGYTISQAPYVGSLKEKDLHHDLNGIFERVSYATRLIYLVNPCNPTGSIVDKDQLKDFLMSLPAHVAVLLDEAYFDYCEPDKRFHLAPVLDQLRCHAIGLRTFSKFHALSGFRVGYAYARPRTIDFIARRALPFSVGNVSQVAALTALRDSRFQDEVYRNNARERRRLGMALDRMGIKNLPTQSNFIMFDCPLDRNTMRSDLQTHGIFMPHLDGAFRPTENYAVAAIGLPEHNEVIINYLSQH